MKPDQILSDVCILIVLIALCVFGYFEAAIVVGIVYGFIVWCVLKSERNKND